VGALFLGQSQTGNNPTATPTIGISSQVGTPTEPAAPTATLVEVVTTPTPEVQPTDETPPTAQATTPPTPALPTVPPTQAPTAVVTGPLPTPVGILAFEDNFDNGPPKSGLEDEGKGKESSRGFHTPGVYHFRLSAPDSDRWVVLPRLGYNNFTMQTEVWDNSDTFEGTMSQGVVFRFRDANHFYAFLLDPRAQEYAVRKADGQGVWTDIIPWKPSPLIKQKAEHNAIRVDADGDTFTLYLNDAPLDTFKDSSYGFGLVGMMAANVDAILPHTHFDNLMIWNRDPIQALPPPTVRENPAGAMVLIPGGDFIMGSNEKLTEWSNIVNIPDYYIDRTEVTNAAYAACIAAGACSPQKDPGSETHPVYATQARFAQYPAIHISWEQARDFCTWAGKRLPTEAEWEKAASWNGGTHDKVVWPWGNTFDATRINSAEANTGDTTPASQYPAELNGTFDMGGNVSEWTSSLFKPYPYRADDGREDLAATGDRVFRGGSWAQTGGKAHGSVRQAATSTYADREIGFRCAANP